jgi:hypothetical protein
MPSQLPPSPVDVSCVDLPPHLRADPSSQTLLLSALGDITAEAPAPPPATAPPAIPLRRPLPWVASLRHTQVLIPQTMQERYARRPGGIMNPGPSRDPLRQALQDQQKLLNPGAYSGVKAVSAAALLRGTGGAADSMLLASGPGAGARGPGLGSGQALLGRFGVKGGGAGVLPRSRLLGLGGNARRVVYVLDDSGSMIDGFPLLRRSVCRSIRRLVPLQRAAVVVFALHAHVLGPPVLLRATGHNRRLLVRRVMAQHAISGSGNDGRVRPFLRAMSAAMNLLPPPQLIYFVTDGHFSRRLVAAVRRLNRHARVRLFTYAFFDRDHVYRRRLQRIAMQNGGKFRYVRRGWRPRPR